MVSSKELRAASETNHQSRPAHLQQVHTSVSLHNTQQLCSMCKNTQTPLCSSAHFVMHADSKPIAKGHVLLISKRHVSSYFELTAQEAVDLYAFTQQVKAYIDKLYHPDGYNIGINDGEWAGQSVPHLHIHVIPRYKGDAAAPAGGVRHLLVPRL